MLKYYYCIISFYEFDLRLLPYKPINSKIEAVLK